MKLIRLSDLLTKMVKGNEGVWGSYAKKKLNISTDFACSPGFGFFGIC